MVCFQNKCAKIQTIRLHTLIQKLWWNLGVAILFLMKKDPSYFRKYPEQWFFRPDLNFFLDFEKKNIHRNHYPQNNHWKIFFSKKNLSKKFANKIGKKNLWKKKLKINFFLPKIFYNGYFESNDYGKYEIGP